MLINISIIDPNRPSLLLLFEDVQQGVVLENRAKSEWHVVQAVHAAGRVVLKVLHREALLHVVLVHVLLDRFYVV